MALKDAIKQIEKSFGAGALMQLGSKPQTVDVIPTGSLALDVALGVGGYARGRVVEIFGPEASGKTTLATLAIAQAQALGDTTALIDAEHAFDPAYAAKLGVDPEKMWINQPDTGEQALEIADALIRSQDVGLIVVDSVAALTPKAELEGEMGDSHMGLKARMMSQAMRKMLGNIKNTKTTLIFINQVRMKIGVMFGNPETTPGGMALKFAASQRLRVARKGNIADKKTGEITGITMQIKVLKNKVAAPFTVAETDLIFGHGVDTLGELVDLGEAYGHITKTGAWYNMTDGKVQGREAAKEWFAAREQAQKDLRTLILESARG